MKLSIPVVTRTQDNGDGGFTTYAYNNTEELLKDHPLATDFREVNGKWQNVGVELTPEQRDEILNENDPYENGYIGKDTIELEIDGIKTDGVPVQIKLAKPISFHAGQ